MNKSCIWIFLAIVTAVACSPAKNLADKKISAPDAKKDIILARQMLEKKHPALYQYTTPALLDEAFQNACNINDSIKITDLKNKLSKLVALVHCGHTTVRFPKSYDGYFKKNRYPRFPLSIKTWSDSMVVLNNLYKTDSIIKKGTKILSIDSIATAELIDSFFRYYSKDGYANNFVSQVISLNFPFAYKTILGLKEHYLIQFANDNDTPQTALIKNYSIPEDSIKEKRVKLPPDKPSEPSGREKRKQRLEAKRYLRIDENASAAYIRLNTFSSGKLRKFFKKSFKTIHQKQIQHLIIDLRQNGGGSINMSARLARYINPKSFKVADSVTAIDRSLKFNRYANPPFIYWAAMLLTSKKMNDGKYHFRALEKKIYKPIHKYHFNNRVYVIQGGFTFSAAAMFVLQVKDLANVLVVGEETGGGAYSSNAVHLPEMILPNSKIRIVMPVYHIVFNKNSVNEGKGISPHIYIPPSSYSIKHSLDPKLDAIEEMIGAKLNF